MSRNFAPNTQKPLFEETTDAALMRRLLAMPKIDLHRHLTGSIDVETAIRIAAAYDVELPTYISSELQDILFNRREIDTLKKYFTPWSVLNKLYVSSESTREIISEAIAKAASDNVIYVEFRTSPRGFLGPNNPFTFEDYAETISAAVSEAAAKHGIVVRFILGIARHVFGRIPLEDRNRMFARIIDIISTRRDCFVGVDLNGDETAAGGEGFGYFFRTAREKGFKATVHAGEHGPAANVRYAVENLLASRIGHGIAAAQDPDVLELLAERNCALEICPTSNAILGVATRTEDLPLRILQKSGVPFVICSDNPARCRTSLTEELFKVSRAFDMSFGDLENMVSNTLDRSFADPETKSILFGRLNKRRGLQAKICVA